MELKEETLQDLLRELRMDAPTLASKLRDTFALLDVVTVTRDIPLSSGLRQTTSGLGAVPVPWGLNENGWVAAGLVSANARVVFPLRQIVPVGGIVHELECRYNANTAYDSGDVILALDRLANTVTGVATTVASVGLAATGAFGAFATARLTLSAPILVHDGVDLWAKLQVGSSALTATEDFAPSRMAVKFTCKRYQLD